MKNFEKFYLRKFWQFLHLYSNIPSYFKSIHTTYKMAKSLIWPGRLLWNLVIYQILYTYKVKVNWILFPASKNNVLSKKFEFWRRGSSAKLGLFINQPILSQFFCVTSTESLVCWVIMSWVIQVYNIQKSSQLLSVWSISANIQCVFWTNLTNTIIFLSNWLCSKFSLIYPYRGVK